MQGDPWHVPVKEPPHDRKKVKNIKHSGSITFDKVINIARTMRPRSMARTLGGTCKEIRGMCQSRSPHMTERRSRTSSTVVASLLTKLSTLPVPCPPPQYGQDPGWNMQGDPWHVPVKEPPHERKKVKNIKHSGSITFDKVINIARTMPPRSMARTLGGTCKEIRGMCQSRSPHMTERRSRTSSTVVASLLTKLSTLPVPCPPAVWPGPWVEHGRRSVAHASQSVAPSLCLLYRGNPKSPPRCYAWSYV